MASAIVKNLPMMHLMCILVILGILGIDVTHSAALELASPLEDEQSRLPDGYTEHPEIKVAYKIHEQYVTWIEAMRLCEKEGGQLATIDSFDKIRYVTKQRQSPGSAWVGIVRMLDDTIWMGLATATDMPSLPWAPNEPWGEQDCVMINGEGRGLVNNSCNVKSRFVCEIQIVYDDGMPLSDPPMIAN